MECFFVDRFKCTFMYIGNRKKNNMGIMLIYIHSEGTNKHIITIAF